MDGVVALPTTVDTREQLEWLADEVIEAAGEATIWVSESVTAAQERALAATMADRVAAEYQAIISNAENAGDSGDVARRRTLARLRRELRRVRSHDYFPPPERDQASAAVERLAQSTAEAAG